MNAWFLDSELSTCYSNIENPSKQSTFNNMIVLGNFFRSIALMMHPVGATTNCEKEFAIL